MQDRIRILLVEDLSNYADMLCAMLAQASGIQFEVEWAPSLVQGLERLPKGRTDVILLDLSLSEGQGLDSFLQLRSEASYLPIIVLSSVDDETVAVKAVHEGAQDYLVKGEFDRLTLIRAIRYGIERKRTEVALLQAEEKYRGIFEHTVEGIFQTTPSGQYLSANPALARIYGYETPADLMAGLRDIGQQLYVDPLRRPEFIRLMEENDVVRDFESKVYRKDGKIIWISENVRAVRNKDRKAILYYEGTVEDISARQHAAESLRNSEALYHSLVENLPQNIFRKNLAEQFTFANRRFCETIGKTQEEIIGKTDFDLFPAELAAKYQKDDQIIMETGKIFETIEENQPRPGEKRYVNVVKSPVYDAKGQIVGLQGIFWDITERKEAEERVKKATMELARNREELRHKNEQLEDDLKMAREIQQAILPQQYPTFPRFVTPEESILRFCHRYCPTGQVGGDFFNILALSDTKAGVFICDVMGHGVRSALVTAIVRALVEELTRLATDPGKLLAQINRDLRAILKQSGTPMFTTAFYMVADLETKQISYANAGHPKPLALHRDTGTVTFLSNATGKSEPALGIFEETQYSVSTCPLGHQDLIMLFTDGIYDVDTGTELSSADWLLNEVRLRNQLSAPELFDDLLRLLQKCSTNGEFVDDICLVGMEVARAWD